MRVHLVDGTYELFRAFYGAPRRLDANGMEVGAARGLLSSMLSLLKTPTVTHVAVAFDHVIESFRNQLFAGYKTGEGIEPELAAQFTLAEDACAALGLVVWPMVEFEADDALATGAELFRSEPSVEQVVLCSPDKDLAQCIKGNAVVAWDRMRGKTYDERGATEKFGVPPASIPDYLALVGDTADGIPGVPRWGAKSAATVLQRYLHIENIPRDVGAWDVKPRGAVVLAENLVDRFDAALLYRTLATLRTDVALGESLEDLRYRGPVLSELEPLVERLALPALISRVHQRMV